MTAARLLWAFIDTTVQIKIQYCPEKLMSCIKHEESPYAVKWNVTWVTFWEACSLVTRLLLSSAGLIDAEAGYSERRWSSGNTLASDVNGPGSTPGRGTLEDDSFFHPFGVGKLSTSFMLGVKSLCTALGWQIMCRAASGAITSINCIRHSAHGLSLM